MSKETKFEIGQRVAVYIKEERCTGVVTEFDSGLYKLHLDSDDYANGRYPWVLPQTMRRLIPRKKGKLITREIFAKAWDASPPRARSATSEVFRDLCERLGL